MISRTFVGRERELQSLRRELDHPRPTVAVVMGRRRVGKSRLLIEATRDRPTVYYQATKIAGSMSLSLFKTEAGRVVGTHPLLDSSGEWMGVMAFLEQIAATEMPGLTVVLDEFPYLCEVDPALPSVLQKFTDGLQKRSTPLNLVLCGSRISFMEELLGERNPLHGRHTFQLTLDPLPFRDAARFFPDWQPEEQLRAWSVFGGIPHYLALCDPDLTLQSNVLNTILSTGAPLAEEPGNLLMAELRDVSRYATILRSVADGCTVSGDIIARVRELRDASALAPYVRKLEELRLIRIVRSLDATEHERNRRYYLDDPFLAYWYRFYLPNASALAAGYATDVWDHAIQPLLDEYMGSLFEWICRDYMRLFAGEALSSPAREAGQIWGKEYEIDVAGRLLDSTAFAGECKWWKRPVGVNVLARLRDSVASSSYFNQAPGEPLFLLFSRSGFSDDLRREARADSRLRLLGPEELLGTA